MIPLGVLSRRPVAQFSPAAFEGLDLWLDAGSLTSLTAGDPVELWPDLSGAGNDATQATPAQRPQYSTALGYPSVYFDGTRWMSTTASASGSAQTAFFVATADNVTTGSHVPLGASGAVAFTLSFVGRRLVRASLSGSSLSVNTVSGPEVGVPTAAMGRYEGPDTLTVQRVGGSPPRTASLPVSLSAGRTLQVGAFAGTYLHLGHIAEIIHYSVALSDAQVADVFTYLATKYSL